MVDDALAGTYRRFDVLPSGGTAAELHRYRAQTLARLGENAGAVYEYLGLLEGRFGGAVWSPGRHDLEPALVAAVRLGNDKAIDEIATRIAAEPGWHTESSFLNTERPGRTPARRLAHAEVALSLDAEGERDYAKEIHLCEEARELAPDEVPVLVRLADAYKDRRGPGDLDRAQAALRRAYALLPAAGNDRRDLRVAENDYGLDPAPPGNKTTLQQAIAAFTAEGPARQAARQKRMAEARARLEAERAAPLRPALPPLGGTIPHF